MGRLENKVALVTGAARGQGRSHAVRLAEEGADIVAIDICAPVATVPYDSSTPDDLAITVELVKETGRHIIHRECDIRDLAGLQLVVADAVEQLGGIDIVVANAGITSFAPSWELSEEQWQEMVDINLTGAWKTTKAAIPSMIERGKGGSIILTSSIAGVIAFPNLSHYTAAKHGVTGLMRALAIELAPHNIRVNSVHPTNVNTPMINNSSVLELFFPHLDNPTQAEVEAGFTPMQALRIPWLEPIDVSNAVVHFACDESRYVTGTTHVIDAGGTAPFKIPSL
ncbi:3-ketoacyl-ACP reductase [Rhodococcus oxybenzonivorans]|uniref:3-ketoacyl-ACP reductase n=1 Tax=Rhodococcus oxybenzonivorans TaxID=1990687 RepID=A0A2S2BZA7_9NOCA|nr:mycofactocin-coupled SDR family oxidoreductase [Rhodococcus oxybenzonivorans]AWK73919.1 3-ketoacyl-ACP reductase [Rhodococcus oxybenzonivorans]